MDGGGNETYGSTVPFCGALHVPDIPEHLTRQAVARRVMAACQNIRILPDPDKKFLGMTKNSLWRQVVREWQEYASEDVRVKPPSPPPEAVTDCMVVLGWCAKLDNRDFMLIWHYSFDKVSFFTLASRYGRSHVRGGKVKIVSDETMRNRYYKVIDKIWAIALREAGFVAKM